MLAFVTIASVANRKFKRAKSCNFSDHTVDIHAAVEMTVGAKPPSQINF